MSAGRHLPFFFVPGPGGDGAATAGLFVKIDEGRFAEITPEDLEAAFGEGFDDLEAIEIRDAVVALSLQNAFKLPPTPGITARPLDATTFADIKLIIERRQFARDRGDEALNSSWSFELARVLQATFLARVGPAGGLARGIGITGAAFPLARPDVEDVTLDDIRALNDVEKARFDEHLKGMDAYMARVNEALAASMKVKITEQAPVFEQIMKAIDELAGPATEELIEVAPTIALVRFLSGGVDPDPDGPRPENIEDYIWDQYRALFASDGLFTRLALVKDRIVTLLPRHTGRTKIFNLLQGDLPVETEREVGDAEVQNEPATEGGAGLLPLIEYAEVLGELLPQMQTVEDRLAVIDALNAIRGEIAATVKKIRAVPGELSANPPKLATWSRFIRRFSDFAPEVQHQAFLIMATRGRLEEQENTETALLIEEGFIVFLSVIAAIAVLRGVKTAGTKPLGPRARLNPTVNPVGQPILSRQMITRAQQFTSAVERTARGASKINPPVNDMETKLSVFTELRNVALRGNTRQLFEAAVQARAQNLIDTGGITARGGKVVRASGIGKITLDWAARLMQAGTAKRAVETILLDLRSTIVTANSIAEFSALQGKPLPPRNLAEADAFTRQIRRTIRQATGDPDTARFNLQSVVESAVREAILLPKQPIISKQALARILSAVRASARLAGLTESQINGLFGEAFRNLGVIRVFERPLPEVPEIGPIEVDIPIKPLFFTAHAVPPPLSDAIPMSPNVLPDPVFVLDLSAGVSGAAAAGGNPLPSKDTPEGAALARGVEAVSATRPTGADTAAITFRQVLGAPVSAALRGLLSPASLLAALEEAMAYGAFHLAPAAVRGVVVELVEAFNLGPFLGTPPVPPEVVLPVEDLADRFVASPDGRHEEVGLAWAQVVARVFRLFETPNDPVNFRALIGAANQGDLLVAVGAGGNLLGKSLKVFKGIVGMASRMMIRRYLKGAPLGNPDPVAWHFVLQELFWTPAMTLPGMEGVVAELADAATLARAAWLRAVEANERSDPLGAASHVRGAAGLIDEYQRLFDQARPALEFGGWADAVEEDLRMLRDANAAAAELAAAVASRQDQERRRLLEFNGPARMERMAEEAERTGAEAEAEGALPPPSKEFAFPVGPPRGPLAQRAPRQPPRAATRG